MTEDNAQLIQDLIATKERVQQGWCPTGSKDDQGNRCVLGCALEATVGLWPLYEEETFWTHAETLRYVQVQAALAEHTPTERHWCPETDTNIVAQYNDLPTTTQLDIENLIDKSLAELGGLG